jgi:hypothetical protein
MFAEVLHIWPPENLEIKRYFWLLKKMLVFLVENGFLMVSLFRGP